MVNRISPPMAQASINDIGGAICRRHFTMGERKIRPGDTLTEDEVLAIPKPNLTALRDSGYLQVYPKQAAIQSALAAIATTRFPIHRGCGKYDVIDGVQLNTEQLTKEQALALVAEGAPPAH